MTHEELEAALAVCSPENRPKLRERMRALAQAEHEDVRLRALRYGLLGGDFEAHDAAVLRQVVWTRPPPADFEAPVVS